MSEIMFSEILQELRKDKNLTQGDLGKLFGLSRTAIASYESGQSTPSPQTLIQLADFFDVSLDYLVGRIRIRKQWSDLLKNISTPLGVINYVEIANLITNMEPDKQAAAIIVLKSLSNE